MTKQAEALQLRLQGQSYAVIGKALGISRQRVQQILAPPTAVRWAVVDKADGKCENCGILVGPSGQVHHKGSTNGDSFNNLANLELLCLSCHRAAHLSPAGSMSPIPADPEFPTRRFTQDGKYYICGRCGHRWINQVPAPGRCPECQTWMNR